MAKQLQNFYDHFLVPEIVDSRYNRSMTIRDPPCIVQAQKKAEKKKEEETTAQEDDTRRKKRNRNNHEGNGNDKKIKNGEEIEDGKLL